MVWSSVEGSFHCRSPKTPVKPRAVVPETLKKASKQVVDLKIKLRAFWGLLQLAKAVNSQELAAHSRSDVYGKKDIQQQTDIKKRGFETEEHRTEVLLPSVPALRATPAPSRVFQQQPAACLDPHSQTLPSTHREVPQPFFLTCQKPKTSWHLEAPGFTSSVITFNSKFGRNMPVEPSSCWSSGPVEGEGRD